VADDEPTGSFRTTEPMIERRHLLRTTGIALTAALAGCSDQSGSGNGEGETDEPTPTATDEPTPTATDGSTAEISGARLTINNVGFSAWEVVEDETGSVAPTGEENPTMTFEIGQRYAVTNDGWSTHPFALRAADDTPLLSQDPNTDGEFDGDADVAWVDEQTEFSFTFTEALAAEVDYYICTVHSPMRGSVEPAG
jgi:hypothetical protein